MGAVGHEPGGYAHAALLCDHGANRLLVIEGFLAAGLAALEEAVVALRVEETLFVEARLLEAMVHIGGDDKVIRAPYERQELVVHGPGRVFVAVDEDVAAPVGPVFLRRCEGEKASGVHIADAVYGGEVREVAVKAFARIGEAGGGGKARARADHDGIAGVKRVSEPCDRCREVGCRSPCPHL